MDEYIYFDTCILSEFAKHEELWDCLREYLLREDLVLAITGAQLVELFDASRLHENIIGLVSSIPSKLICPWDEVIIKRISEGNLFGGIEICLQPYLIGDSPEQDNKDKLMQGLLKFGEVRNVQNKDATRMEQILNERKKNFPPEADGKYSANQARKFASRITKQWLKRDTFLLKQYKEYGYRIDHFRAIEIFAYFIFYKYYLANQPVKESDFGDLFHLFNLAFVKKAVMENNMVEYLHQIQRNHAVLSSVEIFNIKTFRQILGC